MAAEPPAVSLSWSDIAATIAELTTTIEASGRPQLIVGIMRGGMIPAVLLAHRLAIRDVRAVPLVRTSADGPNVPKYDRVRVRHHDRLPSLTGRDVLVVDDVAGTGQTMATAERIVTEHGASRVRTAVCAVNTANYPRPTPVLQEINFIGSLYDGWVVFPWEVR